MTTAKQARDLIGRRGMWQVDADIAVLVEINDVRKVWDRTDYQVKPVAGSGRRWVSAERVKLMDAPMTLEAALAATGG